MRTPIAALLAIALFPASACASTGTTQTAPAPAQATAAAEPAPRPLAIADLKSPDGSDVGTVTAWSGPRGMLFVVEGRNWPEGWHGVHLHAVPQCDGPAFTSAGAHANHSDSPNPHGLLNPSGPDLGDLQNVYAGADGAANAEVFSPVPGQNPIGLSFVVHANRDDHHTQPIGGAGPRIACGVFETPLLVVHR